MDHAYITGVGFLWIEVDSFFRLAWSNPCAWKEKFFGKTDSKGYIFGNSIPETLASDNAPEFCDEDLNYGWKNWV